jgi:hypothetical protein
MKIKYEKPVMYSEKLILDSLRGQLCCKVVDVSKTGGIVPLRGCTGVPCDCPKITDHSY